MAMALPAVGTGSADSWGAVVGPAAADRAGSTLRAAFGASTVTADVSLEEEVAVADAFSATGKAASGTTGSVEVFVGSMVARGVSGVGFSGAAARGASPLGLAGRGARTASPLGLIGARVVVVVVVVSAAGAASLCSSLGLRASYRAAPPTPAARPAAPAPRIVPIPLPPEDWGCS